MNNQYGLDANYFIRLCAREFNPETIRNQCPEDLARAFARAARTACAEVLNEREFAQQPAQAVPERPTDVMLDDMRRRGLSIDGDNAYKRDLIDCIVGTLMLGKQGANPPPPGHWAEQFWQMARAEGEIQEKLAAAAPAPAAQETVAVEVMRFQLKHPDSGEVHTVEFTRAEVSDGMEDSLYEKLAPMVCQCNGDDDHECVDYIHDFDLVAAPPAAEQPYSTTSDKYRAELYDEVWEKARSMGYGNVTNALIELERMKAADRAAGREVKP